MIEGFLNNIRQQTQLHHYENNSEFTDITICMGRHHTSDDIKNFKTSFTNAVKGTEFEQANLNLKKYVAGGFDPMANEITLDEVKLIIPKHRVFGWSSEPKEKTLSF